MLPSPDRDAYLVQEELAVADKVHVAGLEDNVELGGRGRQGHAARSYRAPADLPAHPSSGPGQRVAAEVSAEELVGGRLVRCENPDLGGLAIGEVEDVDLAS